MLITHVLKVITASVGEVVLGDCPDGQALRYLNQIALFEPLDEIIQVLFGAGPCDNNVG